ncbi:hypothetical protein AHAS_Ahas13G0186000 [Arachis hypogaea]
MATHKDALMGYTGLIAPIQVSRLEKEKKQANYWEAQWCGDDEHNEFEVRKWQHRVRVNTRERTCSCRKWQLTGLPCCHGIAAIQRKNEKPEDYVHHKLTIEAYNRTYQFHINSIPSQEYWEHHDGLPCLPPPYKRPIGRPSKKRKKDSSEQDSGSQYHAKRRYGQITCQTCKRVSETSLLSAIYLHNIIQSYINCLKSDCIYLLPGCKVGHNSRTCPERSNGAAAQEDGIDEDEAREQEANWEETMEAAHATHVADEENLTQNHPQSQPDEVNFCILIQTLFFSKMLHLELRKPHPKLITQLIQNTEADLTTTTNAAPPNATTTPATSSGPAPPVAARPVEPTPPIPPTRGRGRTIRRGRPPTSTAPQTRVASHDVGSNCQIPATPTNASGPSAGPGSMSQGPLGRPTLQAQSSASSRPPTVTRETMAAASPATQSRFTGFMPTPSLKKKKPSASIKKS